jgi:hypothetical protein
MKTQHWFGTTLDCGHAPSPHSSFTTGYGESRDGRRICYECCAALDRQDMLETGRATLYLCRTQAVVGSGSIPPGFIRGGTWKATNWPGSLSFPISHLTEGRHNIAGKRFDAWFTGPDGNVWHGVQYGENTQILHCRRNGRRSDAR